MTATAQQPVQVSRSIDATPETVFDAWLEPAVMRRWMFHKAPYEICEVDNERVVGGKFSIVERHGDEEIAHFGRYMEFQRPNKLVFSLRVPKFYPGETLVTVGIEPAVYGCDVTLTQTGVAPEVTEAGWRNMLESLAMLCAEPA